MAKHHGCFPTQNVFKPRDQKQKRKFFQRFCKKATATFLNFGYINHEVKKRNTVKKKNQKKSRVKQNEKPFFSRHRKRQKKHGT